MNNPIREIEVTLGGPSSNSEFLARYIGARMPGQRKDDEQSRLTYWGIKVPLHRKAAKARFSFSHLPEDEQWDHWLKIWNESEVFDVKSVALIWLGDPKRKKLRRERWIEVVSMAHQIDNWAHSDSLSSLLAEILEARPTLLAKYKKWNRSKNPWLRRQSIVGIYCYARMRKNKVAAAKALALIKPLLKDPHFYVQRGVGWTLREVDRVDSRLQRAFVRKHLRDISSTAWFATSELYPVTLRKQLVNLRRA
jgi:3-methyladenine DNA glycosylase AlkD